MKAKKKDFDCIVMKREAQEAIRAKVQGMTREQEVAFFREGCDEFDQRIKAAEQRSARPSSEKQSEG